MAVFVLLFARVVTLSLASIFVFARCKPLAPPRSPHDANEFADGFDEISHLFEELTRSDPSWRDVIDRIQGPDVDIDSSSYPSRAGLSIREAYGGFSVPAAPQPNGGVHADEGAAQEMSADTSHSLSGRPIPVPPAITEAGVRAALEKLTWPEKRLRTADMTLPIQDPAAADASSSHARDAAHLPLEIFRTAHVNLERSMREAIFRGTELLRLDVVMRQPKVSRRSKIRAHYASANLMQWLKDVLDIRLLLAKPTRPYLLTERKFKIVKDDRIPKLIIRSIERYSRSKIHIDRLAHVPGPFDLPETVISALEGFVFNDYDIQILAGRSQIAKARYTHIIGLHKDHPQKPAISFGSLLLEELEDVPNKNVPE